MHRREKSLLVSPEDNRTIWDLLSKQERGSLVTPIAVALLEGHRPGVEDARQLVEVLRRSKRRRSKALAALLLRYVERSALSEAEFAQVIVSLQKAYLTEIPHRMADDSDWWLAMAVLSFGVTVFTGILSKPYAMVRGQAARSLAALGSKESLGMLASLRQSPPDSHQSYLEPHVAAGLKVLLPQCTAEDYGNMPAEAQANLCQMLRRADDELALAILGMLEVCGTGSAVGAVKHCASHGRKGAVRNMAGRILPVLQARLEKERESGSLLRAASIDGNQALLRAASGGIDTEEGLLLRSAEQADG